MTANTIRSKAISAAIWIIIEATINLTFSILAILTYNGDFEFGKSSKLNFMLKLIYFTDGKGPLDLRPLDDDLGVFDAKLNSTPFTSSRTFGWMIAYATLSAAWILSSLVLLIGALLKTSINKVYPTVAFWSLVTTMNLFAAIVATITYAIDIPNMTNLKDTFDFIDLSVTSTSVPESEIIEELQKYNYTWIPGVIMLIFFSRAIIIWIVDLILLVSVMQEAQEFKKNSEIPRIARPNTNMATEIPRIESWLNPKPEMGYRSEISPSMKADMKKAYSGNRTEDQYPQPSAPQFSRMNSNNSSNWNQQPSEDGMSTLRKEFEQRIQQQQQQKKYGPTELRGQLPWSYFNDPGSSPVPRQSTVESDSRPPVPVPDYTLHFPKRRPNSESPDPSKSSNRNSKSTPTGNYEYDNYRNSGFQNPTYNRNIR